MEAVDHVAIRKSFRFGILRVGAFGTGGRPIPAGRGVELPSRAYKAALTIFLEDGGEYDGRASGYGATEWYEGASETENQTVSDVGLVPEAISTTSKLLQGPAVV